MTASDDELATLYRSLVEQAFDGLVIIREGELVYANPAFAVMTGYEPEEVLGMNVMCFVAPGSQELVAAHIAAGTEACYRAVGRRKDGSEIAVEIVGRMCTFRGAPARLAAMRDITRADRTVDELRRSEARFRQLIEVIPDFVLVHRRGTFIYGNPPFLRHLGLPDVESLRRETVASLVHPDDLARANARTEHTSAGLPGAPELYRNLKKDGTVGLVESRSWPIDWDGEPATVALVRDVSQAKALEQRLVEAELLATVGRLAAAVNHEMNNPLTYLSMTSEVLTGELAGLETLLARGDVTGARARLARLSDATAELRDGILRVVEIAGDFKILTSVRAERPEIVDCRAVVASAARIAAAEIRTRAQLELELATVPAVRAHGGRLGQVVLNLLVNAAQAPAGREPGQAHVVRARTSADATHVLIDVDDSGAGVPAELESRIFEPFFSTKPSSRGSGLGLSISRSLVESFGGTLEVGRSDLGGARFRIRLPIA
jgi:PAS domain S-box-containing protein